MYKNCLNITVLNSSRVSMCIDRISPVIGYKTVVIIQGESKSSPLGFLVDFSNDFNIKLYTFNYYFHLRFHIE